MDRRMAMKYKISDLSKLLNVTTNTIRRYEKNGYLTPERDKSDYRWYNENDISRTAFIRLFIKCGFSHSEIKEMINNKSENIISICNNRLNEIDKELERLKYLRHWLKDNIQLMHTLEEINDNFIVIDCVGLKYIIYSSGNEVFNEDDRLKTINQFIYDVLEVQLIKLFKLDDLKNDAIVPYDGLAMKITDVKRLGLENFITDENKYIETYPKRKCLYGVIEIPAKDMQNSELTDKARLSFYKRACEYMENHSLIPDGDMMQIIVNAVGDTASALVSIPVKSK